MNDIQSCIDRANETLCRKKAESLALGSCWIYVRDNKSANRPIIFEYANDRFESNFCNQLWVKGRKGNFLQTEPLRLIFKVSDRVYIDGQRGKILGIIDEYDHPIYETNIGPAYRMLIDGIDLIKFESI